VNPAAPTKGMMGRLSNDPVVEVISMRWVSKRTWIPVVLVIVTGIAGFGVWRLHGIFGAVNKTSPSYQSGEIRALNPKHVLYEVFGAPGTVATINYLDSPISCCRSTASRGSSAERSAWTAIHPQRQQV
jgi:Mycobacterium membrane protein